MRRAFWFSIRLQAGWFLTALSAEGRRLVPLRPYRILILLLFPLFLLFQSLHWIGFLFDEILFRGYRKTRVKEPLFITGIPRSGTTFVHRTLASDTNTFTSFKTWEALFAPSITQRKIIHALSRIDNWIGGPIHALLRFLTKRLFGGLDHIHPVNLDAPEEDYLSLLPVGGCFIMVLLFPASISTWQLGRFQEMPKKDRQTLVHFYKSMIKKHLYLSDPTQYFLSKNAAFASWIPDLRRTFPDARFIACIRNPDSALSSQLSSLRSGIAFFGTAPAADFFSYQFQTVFAHSYRVLAEQKQSFLPDRLAIIEQSQLKENAPHILSQAMTRLCIPISDTLKTHLGSLPTEPAESKHKHTPLTDAHGPDEYSPLMDRLYVDIMEGSHLIHLNTGHGN